MDEKLEDESTEKTCECYRVGKLMAHCWMAFLRRHVPFRAMSHHLPSVWDSDYRLTLSVRMLLFVGMLPLLLLTVKRECEI